ncbi:Phage antirepressor protein KilAC domain protein [Halomonas sp. THAF12]|uniref:phage antirepressor KilAC domain-containing protein n=1 Tax=Halomonas sp. THAF12 TaxID=2587849 RepID=UPI0012A7B69C|nr:phage regulatory protein/antirepressor Ant [Halomonas sp. THAF12]QFT84978.1 Phage antirepressor protein KilAC domain protein [Halomonas sp. THAF12]
MNDSTTMVHSNVQGQTSPAVSMSSVEIAETTGKKHMHVIRDVRAMLKQLYGAYPNLDGSDIKGVFEELRSDNGQTKAFHLDREHAECLVTGYSAALRMKVIRRLRELEEKAAKPDPMKALNDPATLREVLLGYSERVLELESTVSEQAPKVDAYDRISNAEGSLCLTDASKHLQVQRKRLIAWLHANRWIYRRVGNKNWVAYEERRKQQVLTHKTTTITLDDGSERLCEQVRVTPKGLAKLAVVFDQEAAA